MVIPIPSPSFKSLLPWTLVLCAGGAFAQAPVEAAAQKPTLPTQLQYSSAVGAYKAYADQPVQSWRDANDRVGQIGGWKAYAQEIKTGEPASLKDASPDDQPHAGHHGGSKP